MSFGLFLLGTGAVSAVGLLVRQMFRRSTGAVPEKNLAPALAAAAAVAGADGDVPAVTYETADRTVCVIDNGGTPFVVHLSYKDKIATVCRTKDMKSADGFDLTDFKTCNNVLWSFRYKRVFIGLDPNEPEAKGPTGAAIMAGSPPPRTKAGQAAPAPPGEGEEGEGHVWWHGGNSVLLDLGAQQYVFIGWKIISFTMTPGDDAVRYVSTMGNSAVVYPFAVGTKNTYMLIQDTYIPNFILERFRLAERVDAYLVMYHKNLWRWLPGVDPRDDPSAKPRYASGEWSRAFPLPDMRVLQQREGWI